MHTENCHLLTLNVVTITYERRLLTRGPNYSDFTWKLWYFGKVVTNERWSLKEIVCLRGGHLQEGMTQGGLTVCLLMPR